MGDSRKQTGFATAGLARADAHARTHDMVDSFCVDLCSLAWQKVQVLRGAEKPCLLQPERCFLHPVSLASLSRFLSLSLFAPLSLSLSLSLSMYIYIFYMYIYTYTYIYI